MEIIIKVKKDEIKLLLQEEQKIIDKFSWREDKNLSQKLLVEIDNLLQKNNLTSVDIAKMKVGTDIDDKFTTVRIAKVVAETFNYVNSTCK